MFSRYYMHNIICNRNISAHYYPSQTELLTTISTHEKYFQDLEFLDLGNVFTVLIALHNDVEGTDPKKYT